MNIMVIKFEDGWRLVRNHRVIEVWRHDSKLASFPTWDMAMTYIDGQAGNEVQPQQHQETMQ
jgi:hypothetical protein